MSISFVFRMQIPTPAWHSHQVALVLVLLLCLSHTRSQLVLDDVAEDDELVESVPQQVCSWG